MDTNPCAYVKSCVFQSGYCWPLNFTSNAQSTSQKSCTWVQKAVCIRNAEQKKSWWPLSRCTAWPFCVHTNAVAISQSADISSTLRAAKRVMWQQPSSSTPQAELFFTSSTISSSVPVSNGQWARVQFLALPSHSQFICSQILTCNSSPQPSSITAAYIYCTKREDKVAHFTTNATVMNKYFNNSKNKNSEFSFKLILWTIFQFVFLLLDSVRESVQYIYNSGFKYI